MNECYITLTTQQSQSFVSEIDSFRSCLLNASIKILIVMSIGFRRTLIMAVEKQLIGEHLIQILQKGLDNLIEENRTYDLKLAYNLLCRVKNGTQELCTCFCNYVKKRGRTIVIDPEKDKTMVQELLDFKEKLNNIVVNCFQNNEKYVNSLKESFENFINQRLNKPAEMIGKK